LKCPGEKSGVSRTIYHVGERALTWRISRNASFPKGWHRAFDGKKRVMPEHSHHRATQKALTRLGNLFVGLVMADGARWL
jgi:hypothetical protein